MHGHRVCDELCQMFSVKTTHCSSVSNVYHPMDPWYCNCHASVLRFDYQRHIPSLPWYMHGVHACYNHPFLESLHVYMRAGNEKLRHYYELQNADKLGLAWPLDRLGIGNNRFHARYAFKHEFFMYATSRADLSLGLKLWREVYNKAVFYEHSMTPVFKHTSSRCRIIFRLSFI